MGKKLKKLTRRQLLLAVSLVLILALISFGLAQKHKSASENIPSTSTSSSANTSTDKAGKNSIPATSNEGATDSAKSSASNQTALPLIAPWGNFVSNHSPGKNSSPTSEVATCNSTAGATCYIQFTKGSLTRSLDSKTADSNGSVARNWDVTTTNLSSGKWQITAVATLNGQSKSTSDQLPLEVQW